MVLKRFEQDPQMKKQQLDNLKQLLAFASQAKKEGLADEPANKQELENIRSEIAGRQLRQRDQQGQRPDAAVRFHLRRSGQCILGPGRTAGKGLLRVIKDKIGLGGPDHEVEFQKFLDSKVRS